jgi:hypothetical protein
MWETSFSLLNPWANRDQRLVNAARWEGASKCAQNASGRKKKIAIARILPIRIALLQFFVLNTLKDARERTSVPCAG